MEYFDFDKASYGSNAQDDDAASNTIDCDETDAVADINTLRQEQPLEFPNDQPDQDVANEQAANPGDPALDSVYPMSRAKDPCDFCRTMGFDCFVAKRGVMQNGCTCCISLYRECSFTHAKKPGKFFETLHPVTENADIPTGSLTGKRALKSLTGMTNTDDLDVGHKKGSARFPREAVRILKTWLYEHNKHPYPTEQEKDELKERTGLQRTQISNWLANARRRGKVRTPPLSSPPVSGAVDIPGQNPEMSYMTPLERWKHSPPEHEPAATSDIIRALETTPYDPAKQQSSHGNHVRTFSRKTGSSNDSSHANSNAIHASSASSLETSRSSLSDLSFASAFSNRSSRGSMDRKERRRRRKSTAVNTFNQQKARARSARIFQCTFCSDSFSTKYDWQRHEKSLHLALDKWTCSPQGGVVNMHGLNHCVFCLAANPDVDHLESHNYSACQEKTPQERTFYRKDHLNQHLRLTHNVKLDPSMDKWRSSTTEIKSRCGFCGTIFMTWKDRVDHLASHFKNGADMSQWQGDWGFEPFVQNLVENAMPPYLIGADQKTLDPFKTSHTLTQPGDPHSAPGLSDPQDENCYLRLHRGLNAFIHNQLSEGAVPSDQMIQDEARRIIYGNDDPWNQTCADNPVWLSILKRDTGIEVVPHSDHIQFGNLGMQPPFATHGGLRQPPTETNPWARSVCRRTRPSSSVPSSGFQSPAFHGTGQSSAAASAPGSANGSYVGSSGVISARPPPTLASDWESAFSGHTSSSVPAAGSADPLVQMGFEPEFLQKLNDSYGDLDQEMQGLTFEGEDAVQDGSEASGLENMPSATEGAFFAPNIPGPIAIPGTKPPDIPPSEAFQPDLIPFPDQRPFDAGGG